jgi:ferric-dicitrate binding protein FerR (iron transport regulator)
LVEGRQAKFLDRATSSHHHRQLDQWRRGSLSFTGHTLENTFLVLKSKRPYAIDIIDREKKVDRGERLVVPRFSGRSS